MPAFPGEPHDRTDDPARNGSRPSLRRTSLAKEDPVRLGPLRPRLFQRRLGGDVGPAPAADDARLRMPGILYCQARSRKRSQPREDDRRPARAVSGSSFDLRRRSGKDSVYPTQAGADHAHPPRIDPAHQADAGRGPDGSASSFRSSSRSTGPTCCSPTAAIRSRRG